MYLTQFLPRSKGNQKEKLENKINELRVELEDVEKQVARAAFNCEEDVAELSIFRKQIQLMYGGEHGDWEKENVL